VPHRQLCLGRTFDATHFFPGGTEGPRSAVGSTLPVAAAQILQVAGEIIHPAIDADDVLGHVAQSYAHDADDLVRAVQPTVEAVEPVRDPVEDRLRTG
jgi:hypothetical protein